MTTTQPSAAAMRAARKITALLLEPMFDADERTAALIDSETRLPELIGAARNIAETHTDCACDDWMIVAPGEKCSYCQLRDALALVEAKEGIPK